MPEQYIWLTILAGLALGMYLPTKVPNLFSRDPDHWIWLFGRYWQPFKIYGTIGLIFLMAFVATCVAFGGRTVYLAWF